MLKDIKRTPDSPERSRQSVCGDSARNAQPKLSTRSGHIAGRETSAHRASQIAADGQAHSRAAELRGVFPLHEDFEYAVELLGPNTRSRIGYTEFNRGLRQATGESD